MPEKNGYTTEITENSFLSLPQEKLLLAQRKHWFILTPPLFIVIVMSFFLLAASYGLFIILFLNQILFFLSILTIAVVVLFFILKIIVDWYFHIYMVTTHKIIEVCFSPLFSTDITDVLLDQVRCTEVDVKSHGIINELINMGSVTVTFDRPTHQEEFAFSDIKDAKEVGVYLSDILLSSQNRETIIWYKGKENRFRFIDEVLPKSSLGVV